MWVIFFVAFVFIVIGAVLWMHRLDGVGEPPYGSGSIATDGGDHETRIVKPSRPPDAQ